MNNNIEELDGWYEIIKQIAKTTSLTLEEADRIAKQTLVEHALLSQYKPSPRFQIGDVVVYKMSDDRSEGELGIVVKCWESNKKGYYYEVYMREQRLINEEVLETDLSRFPYPKNLSDFNN